MGAYDILQIPEVLYHTMSCYSLSTKTWLHKSVMKQEHFTVNSCRMNFMLWSFCLGFTALARCDPSNKLNKLLEVYPKHKCTDSQVLWQVATAASNCVVALDTTLPNTCPNLRKERPQVWAFNHHHYVSDKDTNTVLWYWGVKHTQRSS